MLSTAKSFKPRFWKIILPVFVSVHDILSIVWGTALLQRIILVQRGTTRRYPPVLLKGAGTALKRKKIQSSRDTYRSLNFTDVIGQGKSKKLTDLNFIVSFKYHQRRTKISFDCRYLEWREILKRCQLKHSSVQQPLYWCKANHCKSESYSIHAKCEYN